MNPATDSLTELSIVQLALLTQRDWSKAKSGVYFAAVPYLEAMFSLSAVSDSYGADTGRSVVTYFLANAGTWRGPVARAIKAELKKRTA